VAPAQKGSMVPSPRPLQWTRTAAIAALRRTSSTQSPPRDSHAPVIGSSSRPTVAFWLLEARPEIPTRGRVLEQPTRFIVGPAYCWNMRARRYDRCAFSADSGNICFSQCSPSREITVPNRSVVRGAAIPFTEQLLSRANVSPHNSNVARHNNHYAMLPSTQG
jgi:hypothetical protein